MIRQKSTCFYNVMKNIVRVLLFFVFVDAKAKFQVYEDASFEVIGSNGFSVKSGNYMFRQNGMTFSTIDNSLLIDEFNKKFGKDVLGTYEEHEFYMRPKSDTLRGMNASIRVYQKEQFATFRQHFYPGFTGMSLNNDFKVTTTFPSIQVPNNSNLQYINPCDEMAGWIKLRKGRWDVKNMTDMCGSGSQAFGFQIKDIFKINSLMALVYYKN